MAICADYPYATVSAFYGDLESVTITVSGQTDGSPADFDTVVGVVKTHLEGLTGVTSTEVTRVALDVTYPYA